MNYRISENGCRTNESRMFIKSTIATSLFTGFIPSRVQAKSPAAKLNIVRAGLSKISPAR